MKYFIKYVTLLFVISIMLLFLVGCQIEGDRELEQNRVESRAVNYLEDRYSASFSILNSEKKITSPGPIPQINILRKNYHWEFTVESSHFPGQTFNVYYKKNEETNKWEWSDNYYQLILDEDAKKYFNKMFSDYLDDDYIINIDWGNFSCQFNIDENTTIEKWLEAGGEIMFVEIYLNNVTPEDSEYRPIAELMLEKVPNVKIVAIYGMIDKAFENARLTSLEAAWNENSEWELGHLLYFQSNL